MFAKYLQSSQTMVAAVCRALETHLANNGFGQLSAAQALMIHRIDDQTINAGDLTLRGYYIGSNSSYNLTQMVQYGYLKRTKSDKDRRAVFITVTDAGAEIGKLVDEFFARYKNSLLVVVRPGDFERARDTNSDIIKNL